MPKRRYATTPGRRRRKGRRLTIRELETLQRNRRRRRANRLLTKRARRRYANLPARLMPIARVFPKSFKVQLTTVKEFVIHSFSHGGTVIAMNSINPWIKTGGATPYADDQARGFDEWERLYRNYCVVGSTLHIDPQYRVTTQIKAADDTSGDVDDDVVVHPASYYAYVRDQTRVTKPVEMILMESESPADREYSIADMVETGEKFRKTTIHNDLGNHHAKGRSLYQTFGVYKSFGLKRKDTLFNMEDSPEDQVAIDLALQRPDRVWGTCAVHAGGALATPATVPAKIKYVHVQLHQGHDPVMDPTPSDNGVLCRVVLKQTVVFFNKKNIGSSSAAI